ncbi:NAD-dependent SIR2 family protein deacetylase [Bradyrhizobium sp. USDA 4354]
MVDRLRSAAEQLEAPTCPDCHIEMKWFRSELLADEPTPIIAHLFVCPHCKRAAKTDTIFKGTQAPPDKLAAPRFLAPRGGAGHARLPTCAAPSLARASDA